MTVHVDEISTEVLADDAAPAVAAGDQSAWAYALEVRAAQSQWQRDRLRTLAEGLSA